MKIWVLGAIMAGLVATGGSALACPVGVGRGPQPKPRPVQNVSFQASELIERAARLEAVASSSEQSARAFEREANALSGRARLLRDQASRVNASDRASVLALADDLSSRAEGDRVRAADERARASELRLEARGLRDRATRLARFGGEGEGGGWRRRAVRSTSALPAVEGADVL